MRLFQKTSSMLLHKREADKTPKNQISQGNSSHKMYVCLNSLILISGSCMEIMEFGAF